MTNRKSLSISLAILGVVIILFSIGSSILTKNVFGIPAGNLMIWFGFIALQTATYALNNGFKASNSIFGKLLRSLMYFIIVLSIMWFGIAYILAGNASFNFSSDATGFLGSPKASILHWNIIYLLVIMPIALMTAYRILRLYERLKDRN
ncbi:hypothetical protein [Winogradskyella sp.]|uniref:hypothetical protein n=1 Tax=Winogradskyella sp. TaxID=1883156 RepID=UPI00261CD15B|nr:hypothetical protein [Winogradskyella sp.]